MSYDLFFYSSSDDEDEVNSELALFIEACSAAIEASKPKRTRNQVERDSYSAHDSTGISALVKCTSAIRQMAYNPVPDALEKYLQMGATTARDNLIHLCNAVIELYGQAIASQDLWIWHALCGVYGMNNDVNVLQQSPIFSDLKTEKAPDVPFMANDVTYRKGIVSY
ncbi:reverse transcriptase domain-containing protein [Tanacetum coccineum]